MSQQGSDIPAFVLELTGSEATRGLPLHNLETFIDELLRGMRAFSRSRRWEPTVKAGHPTRRDELVTAFRLVELRTGSAVLTIEQAILPDEPDEELAAFAATAAVDNFNAMLEALARPEEFDPDVADALSKARRALGENGRIAVRRQGTPDHPVVIDESTERVLQERTSRRQPRMLRVSGRLHLIDLEPYRVGIRDTEGIEWTCQYTEELTPKVKALLDANVWVRGVGRITAARRGSLTLEEIHALDEFEQPALFTYEPVPVDDLMLQQGISGPPPSGALALPDGLTEEQVDEYFAAVLGE